MLRAIKELAAQKKIPCYISLEERMACGIGACLACVCQTKMWMVIQMCITPESARTVQYLDRRGGRAVSMNMTAENAPALIQVLQSSVTLKNQIMTASGTFGSGAEYSEFVDLNKLGAVVTKGVANVPWPGNPTPRIAETHSGMLNAIGLQNPGIDLFCKRDIPYLKQFDTKIIVNVCGRSTEDYLEVVERLGNEPVDMLEINISCPNVKKGVTLDRIQAVEAITKAVKTKAKQPVIMKLSLM